ncbi:protein transport protein Sec24B [Cylas formicarius]|uniref:protein transport protein Sec24B n=1 Tax=Cylas formicarius TaxID=197179 RepID=UPI0029584666|nr:protein transport protein Sec24B [Cylas formicarius]
MAEQRVENGNTSANRSPYPLNGINSLESSRNTSPLTKTGHMAPPFKTIPQSQLPPSISDITQKVGQFNMLDQPTKSDAKLSTFNSYPASSIEEISKYGPTVTNVPLVNSASVLTSKPGTSTPSVQMYNSQQTAPVLQMNQPRLEYRPNVNLPTNGSHQPQVNQPRFGMVPPPSQTSMPRAVNYQSYPRISQSQNYPRPLNPTSYTTVPSSMQQPPFVQQPMPQTQFTQPPLQQSQFVQPPMQQTQFAQPSMQQQQFGQPVTQQSRYGMQQPQYPQTGIINSGFNKLWGSDSIDLLQTPNILPPTKVKAPVINLGQQGLGEVNCHPDIFRCTMTKIPESNSLLQKSRLPLGVLIHPFKDLNYLPVIQCNVIVRCRSCRTYINPFVTFVDSKRWKCNLCYRVNELPEEFQYDPISKTYGDPSRRPEIKSSTLEYIAPAEYMLRPPQPAVYLFLLDISRLAVQNGYLDTFCSVLTEELANVPGDSRTQVGFLAYDSSLHYFSLGEGLSQPHEMVVLDIDDIFLPAPDGLLVNLKDRMELIDELLSQLPGKYKNTYCDNSALGSALQVAYKLMANTGGRVTVFQASLPNVGPGALTSRENPNDRHTAEATLLNPANDFYKRLALECSSQQIAVDLFIVNSQYVDLATISGISKFSGGCVYHFPLYKITKPLAVDGFQKCLRRYLTRKIGFEAVMRVRCTRGLSIHSFHGNFFVRSTDLLSLPNINPDAAFGMQVAIEESLSDVQTVCFQAALLYTSSKGERRIRVHTLCVPVTSTLQDIIHSADQQCIVGLLTKLAVDRSTQSSLSDAKEAFINAAVDIISSYTSLNASTKSPGLFLPDCLKLLPLYVSAILKYIAFRTGTSTRLDDRVKAMIDMKTKPLYLLIQQIYPDLYPIHNLEEQEIVSDFESETVPQPPRLQLTARCLESRGAFLMDCGDHMMIFVGASVSKAFLSNVFGVSEYSLIPDEVYEVPALDNLDNQRLHKFIDFLNDVKPHAATLQVIKDTSPVKADFIEKLVEDRMENSLSYHEFLQHLRTQIK